MSFGAGDDIAEKIRGLGAGATFLGPYSQWPVSLKLTVDLMLASGHAMCMAWGPDQVFFYNETYAPFLGARHPSALGRPFKEVWADVWNDIGPLVARVYAGETVTLREFPLIMTRNGYPEETWWSFSYSPLRDESGQIVGLLDVASDDTPRMRAQRERQVAQAQLREGESRFAALVDATSDVIYQMSADWREMRHLSGRGFLADTQEPSILWLDEYIFSEDHPQIEAAVQDAIRRKGVFELEHRLRRADGSVGWTLSRAIPILDEQGNIVEWFGMATDITARRETDARLIAQSQALQDLNESLERRIETAIADRDRTWNNARDLFVVVDFVGNVRAVNPACVATLGWSEQEMVGRSVLRLLHPEDLAASQRALANASAGPLPPHENRFLCRDGSYVWISWVAAPEKDLIYASGRNITAEKTAHKELEAAQTALRQSQKMEAMGQLTGGVAHDFNNLLTPIVGVLDMLQRRHVGGEREQRLIGGAMQSAERAKTLIQRLLAFARRQPLQSTSVDIDKLVRGMADLVSSTTGPQIKVIVEVDKELPTARADANQLEMALLNLCVNARDAMLEGGTLRITLAPETIGEAGGPPDANLQPGKYVRLSVADTGVGMNQETLSRAVEPFFSTKGVGKGTGLGLSMVHGLVAQLGGAMRIRSRPGLGTNVELWLPQGEPSAAEQAPAADSEHYSAQGTVLLVDDEDAVRLSTAEMLSELGYQVVEASSASAALELLKGGLAVDLLVTDQLMSGMTGTDLAREVQELRPELAMLLISGYAGDEDVASNLPRLTKPFRRDELAASLANIANK